MRTGPAAASRLAALGEPPLLAAFRSPLLLGLGLLLATKAGHWFRFRLCSFSRVGQLLTVLVHSGASRLRARSSQADPGLRIDVFTVLRRLPIDLDFSLRLLKLFESHVPVVLDLSLELLDTLANDWRVL